MLVKRTPPAGVTGPVLPAARGSAPLPGQDAARPDRDDARVPVTLFGHLTTHHSVRGPACTTVASTRRRPTPAGSTYSTAKPLVTMSGPSAVPAANVIALSTR